MESHTSRPSRSSPLFYKNHLPIIQPSKEPLAITKMCVLTRHEYQKCQCMIHRYRICHWNEDARLYPKSRAHKCAHFVVIRDKIYGELCPDCNARGDAKPRYQGWWRRQIRRILNQLRFKRCSSTRLDRWGSQLVD